MEGLISTLSGEDGQGMTASEEEVLRVLRVFKKRQIKTKLLGLMVFNLRC